MIKEESEEKTKYNTMILQSEYDAEIRRKRLKITSIVFVVLIVVFSLTWFSLESIKIKPFFKDEATKKAYEQAQIESSFQKTEDPEVNTYTEDEFRTQKPEIYREMKSFLPPDTDITILKK
jgi:flagellar basal body-associated protein FliL